MFRVVSSVLALVFFWVSQPAYAFEPVEIYPKVFREDCRNGNAKLYDECGDQFEILRLATAAAEKEHKVLVVSYGAEWCIWCHAFDTHLKGQYGMFNYEVEGFPPVMAESLGPDDKEQAAELNTLAAQNIVIAHIDAQYSPNGWEVLVALGADTYYDNTIPFIFSVREGKVAKVLSWKSSDPKEKRRDGFLPYRGFYRAVLLNDLKQIIEAAR